jgi:hypothetical protein
MTTKRDKALAALRFTTELLEQHEDMPIPNVVPEYGLISWTLYPWEHEDLAAAAAGIRRTVGGEWDKTYTGDKLVLRRNADDLELLITVDRDVVCTRRVVGTETVAVPAVEAQPERTEEREVVEWDCAPLLADEQVAS